MFLAMDWFYRLFGNFGVAILLVTVLNKLIFLPLANKSYASMAKMKAVQPEMLAIRDRYADDKMKQQQEMMALYKREKINPLAGCWPVLIQIPVFFALYKVLFVTIEMRHAPFFGWIKDLAAPDPTTIFNLFGLLPFNPGAIPVFGSLLMLGVWPILMGITMFVQMKLNPDPPDPVQKAVFTWMPLIFTFLLASFRRAGDLLDLEQPALGAPAILHHEKARHEDRAVGQHQGHVREEAGAGRQVRLHLRTQPGRVRRAARCFMRRTARGMIDARLAGPHLRRTACRAA